MTVSLGVTDDATGGHTVRDMLHSADLALYAAKRAGRDRLVRADELPRPAALVGGPPS